MPDLQGIAQKTKDILAKRFRASLVMKDFNQAKSANDYTISLYHADADMDYLLLFEKQGSEFHISTDNTVFDTRALLTDFRRALGMYDLSAELGKDRGATPEDEMDTAIRAAIEQHVKNQIDMEQ